MMRRRAARALVYALLGGLAGCASPPARFYTLNATTLPAAASGSDLSLSVGPVSVPAAVDRPEIVVALGPNQVRLDEFNRWASPVQDEVARVVAANLAALLGTGHVTQSPRTLGADAGYRALIEVQRFESAPGEAATLDAVWTVRRPRDDTSRTGRTTVRERVQQPGYDGLAAAHSRALARLSQDIADAIRVLERTGNQAPPR